MEGGRSRREEEWVRSEERNGGKNGTGMVREGVGLSRRSEGRAERKEEENQVKSKVVDSGTKKWNTVCACTHQCW